jgi:uroporphyrinogen decarboxylase
MKPRERVETALNHEIPDRCPMQISFTPEFADRLYQDLEMSGRYYLDEKPYVDEWGIGWDIQPYETPFGTGHYTEIVGHPLAEDEAISTYQPPDPTRPELYNDSRQMIRDFKDEYWIVGVTVTTIFETAWALRGYERLMMDMSLDPDLANDILEIPYRYHLTAAKKLVELGVDMIWTGDDVGTQNRMLISPKMWRQFLKPRMANFIAEIKSLNPMLKVAYHTDGKIDPILPDLIEIGLDVLNPIQPASMDPAQLKEEYGDLLCFWGSIDEQYTLPFGKPSDVEAEVRERLLTVGKDGGLILSPTHHVQLDTPLENFWMMVNTITNTPYTSV